MVEAAIIIPVIVLLTFGAIEFGFAFNEQGTVRSATRNAARSASTNPKGSLDSVANAAIAALNTSAKNLTNGRPTEALVYNPNNAAYAGGAPTSPGDCNAQCASFIWVTTPAPAHFQRVPNLAADWLGQDRNACAGQTDQLAVYLEVSHTWLTGFQFSGSNGITLSSTTLMNFEPRPGIDCGPGNP